VFAFGDRDKDLQLIKRHAAAPWRFGASDLSPGLRREGPLAIAKHRSFDVN
jgi:hypothetical protein